MKLFLFLNARDRLILKENNLSGNNVEFGILSQFSGTDSPRMIGCSRSQDVIIFWKSENVIRLPNTWTECLHECGRKFRVVEQENIFYFIYLFLFLEQPYAFHWRDEMDFTYAKITCFFLHQRKSVINMLRWLFFSAPEEEYH